MRACRESSSGHDWRSRTVRAAIATRVACGPTRVLTIHSTSSDPFSEAHASIVEAVASRLSQLVLRARDLAAIETSGLHRPAQEGAPCS